ncbi:AAA family ATPase [Candidatus Microgenomates bacterium]|nr:AAA family ATPase [Candidatus Microgenomates bacterium]
MTAQDLFVEIEQLEEKVSNTSLPPELKEKILAMLVRLGRMAKMGGYSAEYDQIARYIDWICGLPWDRRSEDTLDLKTTRATLDKNHFGLGEIKERILEYLAVLSLKKTEDQSHITHAPILCLVGLVGTGKTTLGYSVAEAMGRNFGRIPFGGLGDALQLRGQSRAYPDAEPGQVVKVLKRCGTKNPVILLDEIDRVAESARSDIMGVLLELLDPEQNVSFIDHYIDYPFDLSQVLFIATCNNTTNISPAVLDRLEPMQMPSYTDEEKIKIGSEYVFPRSLKDSGLSPQDLAITSDLWPKIVRPLGFDAGIRTLERTIEGICRKVAKMKVEGRGEKFQLTAQNINEFLPSW